MNLLPLAALTLAAAALASWLNRRFLGLPTTIGVMLIALAAGVALSLLDAAGLGGRETARALLERIDFEHALLDLMLAFLLFAGALHVNLGDLFGQKWVVALLATVGVVVTTLIVGGLLHLCALAIGAELPLRWSLVFGSLIAPTDPIAVLSVLKSVGAPRSLATKITGESLFNDGVGVVVFTALAAWAVQGGGTLEAAWVGKLFAVEIGGGLVLGLGAGWLCYRLLRDVDDYHVEILLTLALALGVYVLAQSVHASGPLAVVFAGLLIGNTGRRYAMSERTNARLDDFWELVDEVLNVVLFLLIGLEVLVLPLVPPVLLLGALAIPITLFARFLSVGGTVRLLSLRRRFTPHAARILTWGGLRGGISVALALSLPSTNAPRETILAMTYVVVVFSIAVQGLTIGRLLRRIPAPAESAPNRTAKGASRTGADPYNPPPR